MSGSYPIPASPVRTENRITKSLFITHLFHASSPEYFSVVLDQIRKEHKGASHNCWAYIAGPPEDSTQWGMSDDGEPKGCAGKPMLHVLSHSGLGEIGAIVTRYYGGVKLGTGGLTRAYSKSVQSALQELSTSIKTPLAYFSLILPYPLQPALENIMQRFEAKILQINYEEVISMEVGIAKERAHAFHPQLLNLRQPELVITLIEQEENQATS